MDAGFLVGQIFNGFSVASIYILAAMGLALSFGLMRVINMAHGDILKEGSYLAYLTILFVPGPLVIIVALFVALIVAGLTGRLLVMILVRKLKARPRIGRAHVCTPGTNSRHLCALLLPTNHK